MQQVCQTKTLKNAEKHGENGTTKILKQHENSTEKKREEGKKTFRRYKEYKSTLSCTRCEEDHPACLDFHHPNPTIKEMELSTMAATGYSITQMEKEMNKCEVLCSNCHKKEHHSEW